jgi:hypothetical protein
MKIRKQGQFAPRTSQFYRSGTYNDHVCLQDIQSHRPMKREQGSILAIATAVLMIISILALFGAQTIWSFILHSRHRQAMEAAALKAASDLSQIVVNDPYFGFVSLSDRPAIGQATIAEDGEPVPIHGINTIIAASRLDYLVATEIGDERLQGFALQDAERAREVAMKLDKILVQSLQGDCKDATDLDGEPVHPYADAFGVYTTSLECFSRDQVQDFKLTLGWLTPYGATITPLPYPQKSRFFSPQEEIKGCYKAYVDVPVSGHHFSFASLGFQPSLVDPKQFVPADSEHICTIVKAQASCQLPDLLPWKHEPHRLIIQACGQPYTLNTKPAPSVLVFSFPDGCPPGIDSMRDLLTNPTLNESKMETYAPVGNDYPLDRSCQLLPQDIHASAASAFALAFHDWLRSNYAVPKIDSVLFALNRSFALTTNSNRPVLAVEVASDGNVMISQLYRSPFPYLAVDEKQLYSRSEDPVSMGVSYWTVMCRNEVHTLGTIAGGKHAGQPFPGDPINWDELSTYVNQSFAQAAATRRPGGVMVSGLFAPGGAVACRDAELVGTNGRGLSRGLRKSSYSAGLAAEILIAIARAPLR